MRSWYSKHPSAKHYTIIECPAYVHISNEKKKKLSNNNSKDILVGYHHINDSI